MGRPSKLNDRQWAEIGRRYAAGEKPADLAREFKVARSTIQERFSGKVAEIRNTALALASAEAAVERMPISDAMSVRDLADQLKRIGKSVAKVAATSAQTGEILADLANAQAQALALAAKEQGIVHPEALRGVMALQETANRAVATGLGLMTSQKQKDPQEAVSFTVVTGVPDGC